MTRPDTTYAIAAIDVKDAYLEVPQEEPVIAGLPADYVGTGKYVFLKCVPGQRDGVQRWFNYYVSFIKSEMQLTSCVENPAIMGPVDDGLTLGPVGMAQTGVHSHVKKRGSRFLSRLPTDWAIHFLS